MLMQFNDGVQYGNGKRNGSPPTSWPSGRNVLPRNIKSSSPSGRCTKLAQAYPRAPGKLTMGGESFGFALPIANSPVFTNEAKTCKVLGLAYPVVRSTSP